MNLRQPIALFNGIPSAAAQEAALGVLRSGQIAGGPKVAEFERQFAELAEQPHVVATSDMTSALVLALHLAGVRRGDEVLTLAFNCMSSNSAIALVGAQAVWVDMTPSTASMSVDDLVSAFTPHTRAVCVYHVAGYPSPCLELAQVCRERGISLIEDCNNALGATVDGQPIGSFGDFAIYSFYPNRQVNALEGGALACRSAEVAQHARRLRRFGIDTTTFRDARGEINSQSDIPEIGWSASFSQLNAVVGLEQIKLAAPRLERTRHNAAIYQKAFAGLSGVRAVTPPAGSTAAYWGFLLLAQQRDTLLPALKQAGVPASLLHQRNDGYSAFGTSTRALPGTDDFMAHVLAIPCGAWLSDEQVAYIALTVKEASQRLKT